MLACVRDYAVHCTSRCAVCVCAVCVCAMQAITAIEYPSPRVVGFLCSLYLFYLDHVVYKPVWNTVTVM